MCDAFIFKTRVKLRLKAQIYLFIFLQKWSMEKMLRILYCTVNHKMNLKSNKGCWSGKFKASKWKGLGKCSNDYNNVEWEEGSAGLVWHKSIELYWERKLKQVLNRLSLHVLLHIKFFFKVLASIMKKTFQMLCEEMTRQNIISRRSSTRFVKIT